jgi:histidinol-phosphate/aromatic aminotransferase/cobyric acid decarboxylase-like protein
MTVIHAAEMLGDSAVPAVEGISQAVYGLVLPETRAMVRRLWSEQPDLLYESPYDDRQDSAHIVFLDAWHRWVSQVVTGLPELPFRYVTNGSSEAIRESVWSLAHVAEFSGRAAHLHVFAGEYEGYAAYARAAGVTVIAHERTTWADGNAYAKDVIHRWYVSQPSAIDGNVWREFPEFLHEMARRGIEVAVDLAYVGAVADQATIDLTSPNIPYVFFSLSKVFGVFYHRIGGVLSRQPMLGLEGNKWFKNIFSLYLGTSLIRDTASPTTLPAKYRPVQAEACRILREQHGIPLAPSDVMLLASSPAGPYPAAFRRGTGYRWCLTPTIDRLLRTTEQTAHVNA